MSKRWEAAENEEAGLILKSTWRCQMTTKNNVRQTKVEAEAMGGQVNQEQQVTMSLTDLQALIAEEVKKQTEGRADIVGKAEDLIYVPAAPAKMVKIKLFKDNGMYKEPVFVAVNGHKFIVPRGVEVEVPEYIAEVLETSFRQDQATAEQIMMLEKKFAEDTKKLD